MPTQTRRAIGVVAAALVLLVAALVAYARWIEPQRITIEHVTVSIPGLAPALEGLRVVFLSDLQVDDPGRREARLIDTLEELDPDVLLIGGDFANVPYWMIDYMRHASAACSVLARAPARIAKIGVWGNNDIPEGIGPLARMAGIRVLENEWMTLSLPGGELTIVGLDDPVTGRADWDALFAEPPPAPMLMLAHSPDAFAEASRRGIPALLCGHTHGGQVVQPLIRLWPGRFLRLKPGTPFYRAGRYLAPGGEPSVLYVSRGIGTSYLPFRFLCPPEVTVVHLAAAPRVD